MVFGGKYLGIWSSIERGKGKGGIKSGVRMPVLTPHCKMWGRRVFGVNATMVIFWANNVIFGANIAVFLGKHCDIWSKIQREEKKGWRA